MNLKKLLFLLSISALLLSCWKFTGNNNIDPDPGVIPTSEKVWGYKPVYGTEPEAKKIIYSSTPQPVINGGNIYAFKNYFFQVEQGWGIHVFNNTNPADAERVGFISVKGCSELSIKNDKLYTNSYDDLVVLDFSDLENIKEYSRLKGVFTEYQFGSPISQPQASGYFECPAYGSYVVEWVRDSVYMQCYKN